MTTNNAVITLPYKARDAFLPFHARKHRFAVVVAHRRAGKTESCIAELVRQAMGNPFKDSMYAYIAPFMGQAKRVAWARLQKSIGPELLKLCKVRETDSTVTFPNNATIHILGADNADALRGSGWDGIILDEVGDMAPSVWPLVIRPALADRLGWAVFIGTPKGMTGLFYKQREKARKSPDKWFYMELKASESGLLAASEIEDIKNELDEDEWLQELECSFEAAVKGTYYGKIMVEMEKQEKITTFDHVKAAPVHLAFDLGYTDSTVAWFFQVINGRLDVVDHYEVTGLAIKDIAAEIQARAAVMGYQLGDWWLPHDAEHKSIQTGKTVVDQLIDFGIKRAAIRKVPEEKLYQGIQATRKTLPFMRIHSTNCYNGLEALKAYSKKWNSKLATFGREPKHDWASHSADAMRYLSLVVRDEDITKSAEKKATKQTPAEAKAAWLAASEVNTNQRATYGFSLDDIWDLGPTKHAYIRI